MNGSAMDETVSVPDAGRKLGIGRCTAYRLARENKLPVLRLGKKVRVPRVALERMLADPDAFNAAREAKVK